MTHTISPDQTVFLNIPFDDKYRPLLVALLTGLTALGIEPHSVLELPSEGKNRLDRIYSLIASCSASIHDLSRVNLSGPQRVPRFNMPFELGLAYSVAQHQPHKLFVLEEREYRLQASLSDFNGHDPHIHGGTQDGVLRCLLDCFGTRAQRPSLTTLKSLMRKLNRAVAELESEQGVSHPFRPHIFRQAVNAAVRIAHADGLIA